MNNQIMLLLALLVAITIVVIIQVVLLKKRKKQQAEYPELWKQFDSSMKRNAHDEMIEIGNKLIISKYVPNEHLKIIHDSAQELEPNFPELKELRLNAYHKWSHRTKG